MGRVWWGWLLSAPAASAEMVQLGLSVFFQGHTTRGEALILASAGAAGQGLGSSWCGLSKRPLGLPPSRAPSVRSNIPRDRRWELPISSDLDLKLARCGFHFILLVK